MHQAATYDHPAHESTALPVVVFDKVSFGYEEGAPVLDDVSFQVGAGQILCVMGLNGSGKSTLSKLCNGLLRTDEGTVTVTGLDAADDANLPAIHQAVGLVFQNPDEQIVDSIVEQDVAFGPSNLGVPCDELRKRVDEALAAVGLEGFQRRETTSLSGGQKQRLAIADALALHPQALVLDEPTSMLDPRGRRELHRLLKQLRNDGTAIILISHDREDAAIADKVLLLENGQVTAQNDAGGFISNADLMAKLGYEPQDPSFVPKRKVPESADITIKMENANFSYNPPKPKKRHWWNRKKGLIEPSESVEATPKDASSGNESTKDASARNNAEHHSEDISPNRPDSSKLAAENKNFASELALEGISLSIPTGSFVGLAGATGSGKSTLLQLMAGLLPATSGTVLIDGHDLSSKEQLASQRHRIGYLFQYPQRQLFASTVADDIAFGPKNLGWNDTAVDQAVSQALQQTGLSAEIAERSPFQLSGGQKRRVALAGVLAMKPRILLLDEPMAGLDPQGQKELMSLLDSLNQQGTTILMASHNMQALARHCDTLFILKRGRLVAAGSPGLLLSDTDLLVSCSLA